MSPLESENNAVGVPTSLHRRLERSSKSANSPSEIKYAVLKMNIKEFDRQHLWHPYTSMTQPLPCYEVVSADGVRLKLDDGRELIDGFSSWWASIHGYNHPVLNQAAIDQISRVSHVMFGGITHRPAVELGRKLLQIVPEGLEHIFYSDSGSISVEVAMKMAMQYWYSQGKAGKRKFITPRRGYHGDTWNAMSVSDPDTGLHTIWNDALARQIFVEAPAIKFNEEWNESDFEPMLEAIKTNHEQAAAVILEPIVQGTGGMRFYHPEYVKAAREACDEYGVLLILDEIATGFGRTGKMFAAEWSGITPDIMCVGKALTGGYMTMAATITNARVAHGIFGAFMHGPTFMANPLACAVASASLGLLIETSPFAKIAEIQAGLIKGLEPARGLETVADVRVLGAIGVIEMKQPVDMARIQAALVDRGVWVRPFGRLVYLMPPYIIGSQDLATLTHAVVEVVKEQ